MNYIPRIAEMLGLKIGEEFLVENDVCLHRFTEKHLEYKVCGIWSYCNRLPYLLNGKEKIIKLPYKPQFGDEYWTVVWRKIRSRADLEPIKCVYMDDIGDHFRGALGLIYRTRKEAEDDKYNAFERVTKKTWEEW